MISVIIPTYDRPRQLAECLSALGRSRLSRDAFEVIIVDDGGVTRLDDLVAEHATRLDIRLERQPNRGPAAARNRGAEVARSPLLAFTDDDCLPEPDWLPALAGAAAANPGALIGGETVNRLGHNLFSGASQHLVSYLYRYNEERPPESRWRPFFASNNLAVPAREFQELRGFDVAFPLAAAEDRDLCDRWMDRGLPLIFEPRARVGHAHPLTLAAFWRQHRNYGRGAFHYQRARTSRGQPGPSPEPAGFYLGMLRYPFRHESWPRAVAQMALLALSQVATAFGYFTERRHSA